MVNDHTNDAQAQVGERSSDHLLARKDALISLLLFESRLHAFSLSSALSKRLDRDAVLHGTPDGSQQFDSQYCDAFSYARLVHRIVLQCAVDVVLDDPQVRNILSDDAAFVQRATEAAYYMPDIWEQTKGEQVDAEVVSLNVPSLFRTINNNMRPDWYDRQPGSDDENGDDRSDAKRSISVPVEQRVLIEYIASRVFELATYRKPSDEKGDDSALVEALSQRAGLNEISPSRHYAPAFVDQLRHLLPGKNMWPFHDCVMPDNTVGIVINKAVASGLVAADGPEELPDKVSELIEGVLWWRDIIANARIQLPSLEDLADRYGLLGATPSNAAALTAIRILRGRSFASRIPDPQEQEHIGVLQRYLEMLHLYVPVLVEGLTWAIEASRASSSVTPAARLAAGLSSLEEVLQLRRCSVAIALSRFAALREHQLEPPAIAEGFDPDKRSDFAASLGGLLHEHGSVEAIGGIITDYFNSVDSPMDRRRIAAEAWDAVMMITTDMFERGAAPENYEPVFDPRILFERVAGSGPSRFLYPDWSRVWIGHWSRLLWSALGARRETAPSETALFAAYMLNFGDRLFDESLLVRFFDDNGVPEERRQSFHAASAQFSDLPTALIITKGKSVNQHPHRWLPVDGVAALVIELETAGGQRAVPSPVAISRFDYLFVDGAANEHLESILVESVGLARKAAKTLGIATSTPIREALSIIPNRFQLVEKGVEAMETGYIPIQVGTSLDDLMKRANHLLSTVS